MLSKLSNECASIIKGTPTSTVDSQFKGLYPKHQRKVIRIRLVFSACHLSQCVHFVIVLQRDRNMGRVKVLNGYVKSKAENSRYL